VLVSRRAVGESAARAALHWATGAATLTGTNRVVVHFYNQRRHPLDALFLPPLPGQWGPPPAPGLRGSRGGNPAGACAGPEAAAWPRPCPGQKPHRRDVLGAPTRAGMSLRRRLGRLGSRSPRRSGERDGDDPATWRGFDDSWLGTVVVKRLVWPRCCSRRDTRVRRGQDGPRSE